MNEEENGRDNEFFEIYYFGELFLDTMICGIFDDTFEVKVFPDGHREIHVNFNKNHPEFVRLKAVGNAQFQLEMTGRIEKTTFDQQPFTVLDKTFQYEIKAPEIGIDKEAKFDKKTSTANYSFLFLTRNGTPQTCINYDTMFRRLVEKYNKSHEEALPAVTTPHSY